MAIICRFSDDLRTGLSSGLCGEKDSVSAVNPYTRKSSEEVFDNSQNQT